MTPPGDRTAIGRVLLDAAQARAGDQAAVDAGDTWAALMARAAGHLARGVVRVAGRRAGLRVALVVGKGNNGGDGWAAAHRLRDLGADCTVLSVVPLDVEMSDEAAAHRDAWVASGGRTTVGLAAIRALAEPAVGPHPPPEVVVDCLLGTGIEGAPRGEVGEACAAINRARAAGTTVVACDVPSGVSSDTGAAPGDAVHADATVTMGGIKRGLVLHPGAAHAGTLLVGDLGPRYDPLAGLSADGHTWRRFDAEAAAPPRLAPDDDKRSRGTVLLVAGSVGAAGAAILATRGALWSGAGLTTLATPAHVQRVIAPVVPSAMTLPLRHQQEHVSAEAVDQLGHADGFDAVAAGPGLGPVDGTRAVVDHLRATARRLVLDADAINVYRDDPGALADHRGALVLTPHERELARIGGGEDGADAWAHRVERLPRLAAELDAVIVAKGPSTVVASPDGVHLVVPVGGAELGTGGTGDVLAGMIAAHVAAVPADDRTAVAVAAARAVFLHGFAGRWLAAGRPTADTLVAGLDAGDGPGTPTAVGFGPSSALPDALPGAARVLAAVAAARPAWPFRSRR